MDAFYQNKIMLAPMAGVSDLPYRIICRACGADAVYSEMVSAKGIHYGDKKTALLLETCAEEQPLIVQLFGSDPETMAEAASRMEKDGFARLDINMGCPAPKIVSNGDGSALMRSPEQARAVIRAVVSACRIPVSVKIRSGWDENGKNAVLLAQIAEEEGVAAIAVHGRTRAEFYSGTADWDVIRDVKNAVSVPVIGNGDVFSPEDAVRMLEYTGCDSVMIGRGAQGNPFLFRAVRERLDGKEPAPVSAEEKCAVIRRHMELLTRVKGERIGILEARKHLAWYMKGMRGAGKLKALAFQVNTLSDACAVADRIFEQMRLQEEGKEARP